MNLPLRNYTACVKCLPQNRAAILCPNECPYVGRVVKVQSINFRVISLSQHPPARQLQVILDIMCCSV
jgi:hypothetical protein